MSWAGLLPVGRNFFGLLGSAIPDYYVVLEHLRLASVAVSLGLTRYFIAPVTVGSIQPPHHVAFKNTPVVGGASTHKHNNIRVLVCRAFL